MPLDLASDFDKYNIISLISRLYGFYEMLGRTTILSLFSLVLQKMLVRKAHI